MNLPLPFKDVHPGIAPGWWPPAHGWWWLAAGIVLVAMLLAWFLQRRRRRRAAILALFDDALASANTPVEQVAAISELLRRAARRHDPFADRLQGDAWLALLDAGMPAPVFSDGPGSLLRDGAFRPQADAGAVDALRVVARERYLRWMRQR